MGKVSMFDSSILMNIFRRKDRAKYKQQFESVINDFQIPERRSQFRDASLNNLKVLLSEIKPYDKLNSSSYSSDSLYELHHLLHVRAKMIGFTELGVVSKRIQDTLKQGKGDISKELLKQHQFVISELKFAIRSVFS
jgi:HPt (histidine-containing phosphotransfer) domain-containing protein